VTIHILPILFYCIH